LCALGQLPSILPVLNIELRVLKSGTIKGGTLSSVGEYMKLKSMSVKTTAIVALIIASSMIAVFATGTFLGPRSIRIIETSTYADTVTIYQNGFTFVTYEKTVKIQNETEVIEFYFPAGALTETLRVEGINVLEMRFSQESYPILEKGDIITVYTEQKTYTGKFIGWDEWLLIQVDNQTALIPPERITAIEINAAVEIKGPKILVQVLTDAGEGEYTVHISYLMRGPNWRPAYVLDLNTSELECWAVIENVEDWANVTLTVVSGGPHVVYRGTIPDAFLQARYLAQSMDVSTEWTPSELDEYHEYTLERKITFEEGMTAKLPLLEGTVGVRQEYFWSDGEVINRYHINNTLSEPLATGIIELYRGQKWVGEDTIGYTPVKDESVVIANYAYDIKVKIETVKETHEYNRDVFGKQITIRNFKKSSIFILIQQSLPYRSNLLSSNPEATVKANALTWVVEAASNGGTTLIYYEYETLRY